MSAKGKEGETYAGSRFGVRVLVADSIPSNENPRLQQLAQVLECKVSDEHFPHNQTQAAALLTIVKTRANKYRENPNLTTTVCAGYKVPNWFIARIIDNKVMKDALKAFVEGEEICLDKPKKPKKYQYQKPPHKDHRSKRMRT